MSSMTSAMMPSRTPSRTPSFDKRSNRVDNDAIDGDDPSDEDGGGGGGAGDDDARAWAYPLEGTKSGGGLLPSPKKNCSHCCFSNCRADLSDRSMRYSFMSIF